MAAKSERFEMRLEEEALARVDRWRSKQSDLPSRAEAVRRLVDTALDRASAKGVQFSDGEKILLIMMQDIFRQMKITNREIDPAFIGEVINGGHYWALPWALPGVFHGEEDAPQDLRYVQDVLDMWDRLERGFERLPTKEQAVVLRDSGSHGTDVRFFGFDGNHETPLMGIADFLVNKMNRWSRFKGRDLNSHMPTRAIYGRMLAAFEPMRQSFSGDLTAAQITILLKSEASGS